MIRRITSKGKRCYYKDSYNCPDRTPYKANEIKPPVCIGCGHRDDLNSDKKCFWVDNTGIQVCVMIQSRKER
jgi:hypothetical protein